MDPFGGKSIPQSEALRQSHWSKDFVEHIRTVHFTLLLVAGVLIITAGETDYSRLKRALTQLQQIAKFEQEWPSISAQIYKQAMLDANINMHWSKGVEIDLPKGYSRPRIAGYISISPDTILSATPWTHASPHGRPNLRPFQTSGITGMRCTMESQSHSLHPMLQEHLVRKYC